MCRTRVKHVLNNRYKLTLIYTEDRRYGTPTWRYRIRVSSVVIYYDTVVT